MKLIKKVALAACIITPICAHSAETGNLVPDNQEEHLVSLDAEARLDWQYVSRSGHTDRSETGFIGKYIALKAHGTLFDGLTYTWRQRFSRTPRDGSFWDQTDILDLSYNYEKFDFGVGKQVVMIGGYEYNRAPIELMCPNLFVANVACYQFGVSAGYRLTPSDYIAFQVTQSPFATSADRSLYAFNLQWQSERDLTERLRFETIWSINEIEYFKGKYCNYIALGNKLVIDNTYTILLDLMTRTYPENKAFKNNTFMAEASWDINLNWRVTGKLSYDCNRGVNQTPNTDVARGTQLAMGGVVAEWFPVRKKRHILKLHAAAFLSGGENHNAADLMQRATFYGSLGVTWHMNILNFK